MFTSRAEHRLLLREDNAHARLLAHAERVGLMDAARKARVRAFEDDVQRELARLSTVRLELTEERRAILESVGEKPMTEPQTLLQLLRRPNVDEHVLARLEGAAMGAEPRVRARASVEVKYAPYIERAHKEIARDRALEDEVLPDAVFSARLPGMSHEVHEKLARLRPRTLGQAARISGVTPAAVGLLAVEVRRHSAVVPSADRKREGSPR
jgi:tRNA uridine 5-carboxymethylaminomethyl modification enzyme